MKTALLIGASGLVGSALTQLLIEDSHFSKIIVFTRRPLEIADDKLQEHIIDFASPQNWQHLVQGDVLFSALGTTLKQAGTKEAQFKIDYTYQLDFARAAAENDVPVYVLVSAASANPRSMLFYTRIKGELERDVKKLAFQSISIIQPSLLYGKRQTSRLGEKLSYLFLKFFNSFGQLKKYRPIAADIVAKALMNAALQADRGISTYTLDKIFQLSEIKFNKK